MFLPILVIFAGYTISSYGVVLVKGWDISWKTWINPLDAYQWPSGGVPAVPQGQVLPGVEAAGTGAAAGTSVAGVPQGTNPLSTAWNDWLAGL
jgi:hypothetical protein